MFGAVPEEIIELIWEPLLLPLCLGPRRVTWGHQESSNPGPASSSSRSGGDTACPGPARPECPWALQVCGWPHTGLLSGSLRASSPRSVGQPQAVMGEPEPRGTLPPGSSLPAPGLEEESSFSCSAVHSEVLEGLGPILKSFETHLELIFEVLATGQHKVTGLLCLCGGMSCATVAMLNLGLRSWF